MKTEREMRWDKMVRSFIRKYSWVIWIMMFVFLLIAGFWVKNTFGEESVNTFFMGLIICVAVSICLVGLMVLDTYDNVKPPDA